MRSSEHNHPMRWRSYQAGLIPWITSAAVMPITQLVPVYRLLSNWRTVWSESPHQVAARTHHTFTKYLNMLLLAVFIGPHMCIQAKHENTHIPYCLAERKRICSVLVIQWCIMDYVYTVQMHVISCLLTYSTDNKKVHKGQQWKLSVDCVNTLHVDIIQSKIVTE